MEQINQTAADCLDVFAHVAAHGYRPITVSKLADLTGHGPQKLRRELRTLESRHMVEQLAASVWRISREHLFRLARCLGDIQATIADQQETWHAIAAIVGLAHAEADPVSERPDNLGATRPNAAGPIQQ